MLVKDRIPPFAFGLFFGTVLSALLLSAWYAAVIVPRMQEDGAKAESTISDLRPFNIANSSPVTVGAQQELQLRLALPGDWQMSKAAPSWLALYRVGESEPMLHLKGAAIAAGVFAIPPLVAGQTYNLRGQFYFCPRVNAEYCATQGYEQELRVVASGPAPDILVKLSP